MISDLLDEYPENLISLQWQAESDTFDPSECTYNNSSNCYDIRPDLYTVTGIPTEVFNGTDAVVGVEPVPSESESVWERPRRPEKRAGSAEEKLEGEECKFPQ